MKLTMTVLTALLGILAIPAAAAASSMAACTITATFVKHKAVNRGQPATFIINVHEAIETEPGRKLCAGLNKKGLVVKTRDQSFNKVRLNKGDRIILRFVSWSDDQTGKTGTNWEFVKKVKRVKKAKKSWKDDFFR